MKEFAASGQDITGFIISTVAETEPLIGPAEQGAVADINWFSGFDEEKARTERRQILEATTEELAKWCAPLEAMARDGAVCVVGYADALDACAEENLTVYDI